MANGTMKEHVEQCACIDLMGHVHIYRPALCAKDHQEKRIVESAVVPKESVDLTELTYPQHNVISHFDNCY